MKHLISAEQFTRDNLSYFFEKADEFKQIDHGTNEERRKLASRHFGKQIISLFYEPSTRTRLSFEAAAAKLGVIPISTENARDFSSAAKGETIEDTIRVLNEYHVDGLVMRHHETGAARRASAVAADHMAIINAGDGKGEHPSQALLDAYTIQEHFKRLSDLNVVMGGDLRQGRTVRSLSRVLNLYPDNHLTFVSMPGFEMGNDIKQLLDDGGTAYTEMDDTHGAVRDADVVYWTRLQRERLEGGGSQQVEELVLDTSVLQEMKQDAIIVHPLPRVGEITTDVDSDPRAHYFRQAGNGLYVRAALLDYFLAHQ